MRDNFKLREIKTYRAALNFFTLARRYLITKNGISEREIKMIKRVLNISGFKFVEIVPGMLITGNKELINCFFPFIVIGVDSYFATIWLNYLFYLVSESGEYFVIDKIYKKINQYASLINSIKSF